ncbi:MAG: ribonuclease P protein component [Ignavibacteria bacterium]|nr:ribonuclease P protein component [Ignavibacteria bacterium]
MKPYGLTAGERIKSKRDFENIFKSGNNIYSQDNKLKAIYIFHKDSKKCGVKIATAVFKKSGNAVWRNRVKRLIRVSYRLNKKLLTETCINKNILLKLVFSLNTINQTNTQAVKLNDIQNAVNDIISKINKTLCTS